MKTFFILQFFILSNLTHGNDIVDLNKKKCSTTDSNTLTSVYPEILDDQFDFLKNNKIFSNEWRDKLLQTNDRCTFYFNKKSWDKVFHFGVTEKEFYKNKKHFQKLCNYPFKFVKNDKSEICVDGKLFGYTLQVNGVKHEEVVLSFIKKFGVPIVLISNWNSDSYYMNKSGYKGKEFNVYIETNTSLFESNPISKTSVTVYSSSVLSFIESNLRHIDLNFRASITN